MTSKKVDFRRLSEDICPDCGDRLKMNLVTRNPKAKRCHVCHKLSGNNMNFNRKKFIERQHKARIRNNWKP